MDNGWPARWHPWRAFVLNYDSPIVFAIIQLNSFCSSKEYSRCNCLMLRISNHEQNVNKWLFFRKWYLWLRFILRETINAHVFIIDEYQAFNSWQKNIKQINIIEIQSIFNFCKSKKKDISIIFD